MRVIWCYTKCNVCIFLKKCCGCVNDVMTQQQNLLEEMFGWFIGCLVGWLVGWLVGCTKCLWCCKPLLTSCVSLRSTLVNFNHDLNLFPTQTKSFSGFLMVSTPLFFAQLLPARIFFKKKKQCGEWGMGTCWGPTFVWRLGDVVCDHPEDHWGLPVK